MERAAFLIQDPQRRSTQTRLSCLLNPNTLTFRRVTGVRRRRSLAAAVTQEGLRDDPLQQTGGGFTELRLDLLFDVNLPGTWLGSRPTSASRPPRSAPRPTVSASSASPAGGSSSTDDATATGSEATDAGASADASSIIDPYAPAEEESDVRDLTRPLWNLAENQKRPGEVAGLPRVRFVWGKRWDFPAVVAAVAERLENFTPSGVPQRSFLRLCLLRADDDVVTDEAFATEQPMAVPSALDPEPEPESPLDVIPQDEQPPPQTYESYVSPGYPFFLTAYSLFGDASMWTVLAEANPDVNPVFVMPGTVLRVPTSRKPAAP